MAAMLTFASNSLLNRLALGQETIDAASYTTIRLTAGAVMLFVIAYLQRENGKAFLRGSWISAAFLFLYAFAFSFAYLSMTTGTGALILFGSVQMTMMIVALRRRSLTPCGERNSGLIVAVTTTSATSAPATGISRDRSTRATGDRRRKGAVFVAVAVVTTGPPAIRSRRA